MENVNETLEKKESLPLTSNANTKILSDTDKELLTLRREAESQFDKLIIYISSGAFIFSVGFVKDISGVKPINKSMLIWAWVLFAYALIAILISQITTRCAIDCELTKSKKTELDSKNLNWIKKAKTWFVDKKIWDLCSKMLIYTSLISLLLGGVFLLNYIITNFKIYGL